MDAIEIIDGGLATELERRGHSLDDPLWSAKILIEQPAVIRDVALDYLRAGSTTIVTATYQASFPGLQTRGFDNKGIREVFRLAVELADQARTIYLGENPNAIRPKIAASIGPYGAFLHDGSEYRGNYGVSRKELEAFHRPRLEILAPLVDVVAFETFPSLEEMEVAYRLLRQISDKPAWMSFTLSSDKAIAEGPSIEDAVSRFRSEKEVLAIGANCFPPAWSAGVAGRIAELGAVPIVYPNSGAVWNAAEHNWIESESTSPWLASMLDAAQSGARWLGGCCRTTPHDILALKNALS